jgi:hypothetical protein
MELSEEPQSERTGIPRDIRRQRRQGSGRGIKHIETSDELLAFIGFDFCTSPEKEASDVS